MTFVTRLTLRSGDRAALDGVVADIRETARRKGAEFKGPHADTPETVRARQYQCLDGDESRQYSRWEYTVYSRRVEFVGSDTLPRRVLNEGFPDSVHVEVEVEHQRAAGRP
jgi:ribosomal protein S10